MPGDITPMWEKAVESWKGNTASVDVEVIPTYRYKAVRSEFRNGKAEAYSVDVYQKLVVVKKHDDETGEDRMGQYILTLIPDKGYDRSHRGNVAERFINTGDKGSYSGLAVYFCGGLPMRIAWYENGKETGWISAFTAGDTNELLYRVSIIIRELSDIKFLRCLAVRTKYGEDIWDDWDDPWSGDEDYGGQLPPAIVYPGDNPFPENDDWYEPPETDSYEEGGMSEGDWDSGWSLDDGSGNKGEPEESDDTKIPPTLSEYYGQVTYYNARVLDFLKRYSELTEKDVPKYYKEYGEKYFKKFNGEMKETLSDAGKEWVDKTSVALQVKLSEILVNNPDIELNPDLLEEKAFESHVEAYIESGIFSLPMSDKIEILMTVEYNDLVKKEEGREQAFEVMEEQVKYYFSHPGDAVEDATYLITNFGNILDKIREYVPESAGTKSGYSPEQEVFDLLFGQLIEYYEDHVPGFSLPEIS